MKHELEHFYIGDSYGGSREWFRSFKMRKGGSAAAAACDSSLYFAIHRGVKNIYRFFDLETITREDYAGFAHLMELFLKPGLTGIDTLDKFIKGYAAYLDHYGVTGLDMYGLIEEEEEGAPASISELVERNGYDRKLNTIRDVMERTGVSLAEAKEMVDAYYENETDHEL